MRLEQWISLLDEQAKSGLSKKDWCKQNEIRKWEFYRHLSYQLFRHHIYPLLLPSGILVVCFQRLIIFLTIPAQLAAACILKISNDTSSEASALSEMARMIINGVPFR